MSILLIAERLRVEERLILQRLQGRGVKGHLITPGELTRSDQTPEFDTALIRLWAGRSSAALAWMLQDTGAEVVNAPQVLDLLARRDHLTRTLARFGIATPPATLAWGADALIDAANLHGWPVELLSLDGGRSGVVVEDRESAEAVIEHRAMLGRESVMLVREAVPAEAQRRIVIAGDLVRSAILTNGGWEAVPVTPVDEQVASRIVQATGGKILDVLYLPGAQPQVTLVAPLIAFRDLQSDEMDIAGAIAECLVGDGVIAHVS